MSAIDDILAERERQDGKFPDQHLPDSPCLQQIYGTSLGLHPPQVHLQDAQARERRAKQYVAYHVEIGELTWADVLEEEVAEAFAAVSVKHLREEMVQVAAVALRWIQDIDARSLASPVAAPTERP